MGLARPEPEGKKNWIKTTPGNGWLDHRKDSATNGARISASGSNRATAYLSLKRSTAKIREIVDLWKPNNRAASAALFVPLFTIPTISAR